MSQVNPQQRIGNETVSTPKHKSPEMMYQVLWDSSRRFVNLAACKLRLARSALKPPGCNCAEPSAATPSPIDELGTLSPLRPAHPHIGCSVRSLLIFYIFKTSNQLRIVNPSMARLQLIIRFKPIQNKALQAGINHQYKAVEVRKEEKAYKFQTNMQVGGRVQVQKIQHLFVRKRPPRGHLAFRHKHRDREGEPI